MLALDSNYSFVHIYLGYTHAGQGNYEQAVADYKNALKADGDDTSTPCYLAYAYAKMGQRQAAQSWLKKMETTKNYVSPAELAIAYIGLDDREKALELLEKSYAAHDSQLQWLAVEPHYDSLRSDPRFQDLLRRVGLTP